MRNLINLCEFDEDLDDESDASWEREKRIEKLIRYAFEKVGIQINYNNHSVVYTDEDREAEVRLEDGVGGISLDQLLMLKQTGLAEQYFIDAHDFEVVIKFKVHPDMDHAEIA